MVFLSTGGFLVLLVNGALAFTVIPTTAGPVCERNGIQYQVGESFNPSPCEYCHCGERGQVMCAVADCAMPPCMNAVSKPDQCCPVCPDGPNCRAPDGTLIQGDKHYVTSTMTCYCPSVSGGFHWGAQNAICSIKAIDPVTVSVIMDPTPAVSKK